MRIAVIGNQLTLPYSPDHEGVIQSLRNMKRRNIIDDYKIVDIHMHFINSKKIVDTVREFNPTMVIHGMTDSLTKGWAKDIANAVPNTKQVMSMWDYRPMDLNYDGLWSTWKTSGDYLDLVTLSNKNQMEWWSNSFNTPVMYWPHGCVVKPVSRSVEHEYDCVFVGDRIDIAPYNERVKLIDTIQDELSRYGISITWINKDGGDSDPERRKVWKDLGKIYHSAKTVLDVSHFWDADGYASGRYFYTAGLGGCSISKRFPGCEELFPEGTKAYFDTPEEAAKLVAHYVNNKNDRERMKKRGKKHANKYHSYDVRFQELFKELNI